MSSAVAHEERQRTAAQSRSMASPESNGAAREHGCGAAGDADGGGPQRTAAVYAERGAQGAGRRQAETASSSTVRLRVRFGSTGMPGPIVVATVAFFTYRPLAADGLSRSTSSMAAA